MPTRHRNNIAFTVVVSLAVGAGALVMVGLLVLSDAPGAILLAALLAAAPVGPVVAVYLWLDRYEPEPRSLLVGGLLWGAFAATAGSILLGFGFVGDEFSGAVVVAPFTEEAAKGLFLLLLLWWRRHELDGVLDGIVYAGMVGIGFAFTENILYLASAYLGEGEADGGAQPLIGTFVVRCLASPFAHPFFTTFIGVGVGLAVASRSWLVRLGAPTVGYLLAVAAHAAWNAAAVSGLGAFALTYGLVMLPAFVTVAALAVWVRRSEGRVLTAALHDAAARGLIPPADIPWIADLRLRRRVRRDARAAGSDAETVVREYQEAAIELGFLHHRVLRGTAPDDFASRGRVHLARMTATRPRIPIPTGPGPAGSGPTDTRPTAARDRW